MMSVFEKLQELFLLAKSPQDLKRLTAEKDGFVFFAIPVINSMSFA